MNFRAHIKYLSLFVFVTGAVNLLAEKLFSKDASQGISYQRDVLPILRANCMGCHQGSLKQGNYAMTDFASLIRGGESGSTAITPHKSGGSFLIEEITPVDGKAEMPKKGPPLKPEEIEIIRKWIDSGAINDSQEITAFTEDNPPVYVRPPVVTSIDFSPDGKQLAVAGLHEVIVFDASNWQIQNRLIGISPRIETVRYSPDGKLLGVAAGQPGLSGEVQIWKPDNGELIRSLAIGTDTAFGLSWSPDAQLFSVGLTDNSVRAFDTKSGDQKLFQRAHEDWPRATVFSVDGKHLLSGGRDMTVKLTEVETERFVDNVTSITPGALRGGIQSLARHPSRNEILVGGADGVPRVYRVFRETERVIGDDSNLVRQFDSMPGRIYSVAISPDGQQLAAASTLDGKSQIRIWAYDFSSVMPPEIKTINAKRSQSRNAKENATLNEYLSAKSKELGKWDIDNSSIYCIDFDGQGRLAASGSDGHVRVWSIGEQKEIATFNVTPPLGSKDAKIATNKQDDTSDKTTSIDSTNESQSLTPKVPALVTTTTQLDTSKILSIAVEPLDLVLARWNDSAQMLVTATTTDNLKIDVTDQVKYLVSEPNVVMVTNSGRVKPLKSGSVKLSVQIGLQSQTIETQVLPSNNEEVDFIRDVNPILSRVGCNQGTCHGAQAGKGGFKLSLRGYDPVYDLRALTDDLAGRRFNPASPRESLIMTKPLGLVPHVGGRLFSEEDVRAKVVRAWIAGGAKLDTATPRVTKIELFPLNPVVEAIGSTQTIRVVATYVNGDTRDVTSESFIESGNTEVATVGEGERVTAIRRGEAPILARYEGAYAATTLTVMGDRKDFVWSDPAMETSIDKIVAEKWKRMKITPSGLCSDTEFLRRIHLDLTGLPPTSDQVRAFLADTAPTNEKRGKIIDELLSSQAFNVHWTNKWSDLLMVNSKFLGKEGAKKFKDWIFESIASNKPYDQFVHQVITASGSNRETPAASYFKILRTPEDLLENTTHLFLGVRFNCNKCHDHPFERWTQDQYYQTAAYFSQIALKKDKESGDKTIGGTAVEGAKPIYEEVSDSTSGDVKHPKTNENVQPKFPFDCDYKAPADHSRRSEFASWLTSRNNQYFARSYVNRMWGYLLGKGLIEPIDDIRAGNPASIPELLTYLESEFIESNFDVRQLMRNICNSKVYQLSIETNEWNKDDQRNYSHAMPRRLPAEVLFDAIHQVTGSPSSIPGLDAGSRSASLADADAGLPDGFLNNLGRPARESVCECERSSELRLGSVMALVSGPTLGAALSNNKNSIQDLAVHSPDDSALIDELFLRILNRHATNEEKSAAASVFKSIQVDHDGLVAALKEKEAWWIDEKPRLESKAKEELETVTQQLMAREAELKPARDAEEAARVARAAEAKKAVDTYENALPDKFETFLKEKKNKTLWHLLPGFTFKGTGGTTLNPQPDRSITAQGKANKGVYKVETMAPRSPITAIRLETLASPELPSKGPGLSSNGNFVVTEIELYVVKADKPDEPRKIKLVKGFTDFDQTGFSAEAAINDNTADQGGWAVAGATGVEHWAVFELQTPLELKAGEHLLWQIHQQHNGEALRLGRFRLSVSDEPVEASLGLSETLSHIASFAKDLRSKENQDKGLLYFKTSSPELQKLKATLAKENKPLPEDELVLQLRSRSERLAKPIADDPKLVSLRADVKESQSQQEHAKITAAEDISWALINSPAFLFNH